MGHAMRSRVVLEHLVGEGHEVEVMASGRAEGYLRQRFAEVHGIHGLHMIYEDNRVKRGKTFWSNLTEGTAKLPMNMKAYFTLIEDFRPEVVVSEFDSWTYIYGQLHGLPIISVDNMQIINRCKIPKEVVKGHKGEFRFARTFVKGKLPGCRHYLITTFFRPKVRRKRTTLVPPVLRPEILGARSTRGDHLLVYQTAEGHEGLAETLAKTGLECRIYGMRRSITEEQVEGPLRYRPFSEPGFIADLASARGVIAGGGFTLMSECVYLHKPMLSVPLENQFEQFLNARYLEREGYGVCAESLDDPAAVHGFVDRIPACEEALASYAQDGNRELFEALDAELDRAAAGV
jgi:uncharacterized protein (TIGR00661 family)